MRTLIRYLLFFGLLVGAAFASVMVERDGETLLAWLKRQDYRETWAAWTQGEPTPEPPRTVQHEKNAAKRVAALRTAAERVRRTAEEPKKGRTRVDPHLSAAQKKGLDDLVSSRVGRR